MATHELAPLRGASRQAQGVLSDGVAKDMLCRNVRWFTEVRWAVAAAAFLVGLVSWLAPNAIRAMGVMPPARWPWVAGCAIVAANLIFCLLVRRLGNTSSRFVIEVNIWLQIVVDLLILTTMVHIVGSIDSPVSCFYLLHITLACVFFGRNESLLVVALAALLYVGCVSLEVFGILSPQCIFLDEKSIHHHGPLLSLVLAGVSVFVWVAVWYLVGTLARTVRDRDRQLDKANRELIAADERMNRQVLRTTHDLKAPFAGMASNIQLLRLKYWDRIPDDVKTILERIEVRGHTLSNRIGDILLLGYLRSQKREDLPSSPVDLNCIIDTAVDNIRDHANSRGVTIDVQVPTVSVRGDQRQFSILFGNLLSNAVAYSHEGGQVEVAGEEKGNRVRVSVTDHGIGMSEQTLPRIFDEYFRTREAMKFNSLSTGLGLAIVKKVVDDFGLTLRVTSEEGKGTSFDVSMPITRQAPTAGSRSYGKDSHR